MIHTSDYLPGASDLTALGIGLLVARLVLGLYMAAHGAQKLFGWFRGPGLAPTGAFLEQLGFRPGRLFAVIASTTEFVSGILVVLGLLGPVGPALMLSVLIVAALTVHWRNGLFVTENGIEHAAIFAATAFALALTGPGPFSLDAALGIESLWTPRLVWTAIGVGVMGGIGNLVIRRPPPQHPAR